MSKWRKRIRFYLWNQQRGLCAWCNRKTTFKKNSPEFASIDHIIPTSKGGTNRRTNLQILCSRCNTNKADRVPSEEPVKI